MFHRFHLLRPLLLPLLVSLLPVLALLRWADSSDEARFERFADGWEREALSRVERFRSSHTFDSQVAQCTEKLKRDVVTYFRNRPENTAEFSGQLLVNAFRKAFPAGHRPPGTLLFGFKYDGMSPPKLLSGEGLASVRGRILMDFFVQCIRADLLTSEERTNANRRTMGLFGDLVRFELLTDQRRGKLVAIWFEGKRALLVWDEVRFKGKLLGGFAAIFPQETMQTSQPVLHAMGAINRHSSPRLRMMPFLLHVGVKNNLPRLPSTLRPAERRQLRPLLDHIRKGTERQDLAEPGFISRRFPGHLIYRDAVDLNFPYELWLVARLPSFPPGPIRILAMSSLLFWGGLATLLAMRILIFGIPFQISMRRWFFGFFMLAGVLPLTAFYFAGFFLIETSRDRQTADLLRATQFRLEQVDIGSSRLNSAFQALAHSLTQNVAWCRALAEPVTTSSSPALKAAFQRFAHGGFPLEHILLCWFEKGKRAFVHNGEPGVKENAKLQFWAPMYLGACMDLEPDRRKAIMASLDAREKNVHLAFQTSVTGGTYLDFFNLRQNVHLMESEIEQSLQCYDFISNGQRLAFFVMFRTSGRALYRKYVRSSLNLESLTSDFQQVMAGQLQGNSFEIVHPVDGSFRASREGSQLSRLMSEAARSGSRQFRHLADRAFLAYPCVYMPGYVLGALPSFDPINGLARQRHILLILATLLLAFPIRFLGSTVSQYLLQPVAMVESALVRVAGGDLTPRVSLPREDELGAVTHAFDGMIEGLEERRRLGTFVSGALNQNIEQQVAVHDRFAVLLVSDLRSFTTLSESHPPSDIVRMLNRHLEQMALAIQQEGGLIDRFIGDAVVAMFWGDDPKDAVHRAVQGARGMRSRHEGIQRERAGAGEFVYEMGVGLDCGRVRFGSIGSRDRREQAIVGPARDRAETLESASRHGTRTRIVISESMRAIIPDEPMERMKEAEGYELI